MPRGIYKHKKYQGFQKGNQLWQRKKKRSITKICAECLKQFEIFPSQIQQGRGRYCSKECKRNGQKKMYLRDKNPRWRNGRSIHSYGYILVKCEDHPNAQQGGYIYEHRLVMERHLSRYLDSNEIVCHINGVPTDNRIENLRLFQDTGEHLRFHNKLKKLT